MADQTYTINTLQGYVSRDVMQAGSQEDRRGVAGDMAATFEALAETERRVAALEDLAQKLVAAL